MNQQQWLILMIATGNIANVLLLLFILYTLAGMK